MSMRKPFAVVTIALLPLSMLACGGKEEAPAAPPTTVAAAAPAAPAAAAGTGSASVSGKISFEGTVPAPEKVKVSADPKCQEMHKDGLEKQPVQVKDGGLADVLVYVKSGISGSFPVPAEAATLNQQGCTYHPHIVALQVGQTLKIKNSDDTLHNVHPRPTANAEFNVGQPRQNMEAEKTFDKEELMIPVGCDVHPWMRSYISVFSHPFFAVTKADGTFEIKGLPAGTYEIEANHEKLKTMTGTVTVKDGEAAKFELSFKG